MRGAGPAGGGARGLGALTALPPSLSPAAAAGGGLGRARPPARPRLLPRESRAEGRGSGGRGVSAPLTRPVRPQLLSAADPAGLRLTRADDRIYAAFRRSFPDLRVDLLDVESLKSEPAKEVGAASGGGAAGSGGDADSRLPLPPQKWRPFCLQFEGAVEDFNLGTLLRLDCRRGYSEENSVLGKRRAAGWAWAGLVTAPPRLPLLSAAPRIQFLAIEIARNREGCNGAVYRRAGAPEAEPDPAGTR